MPTYEYHCPACKATYELREGFSAPTTHTCQECGKGTAKRVLYAPPVVFKGSGWYVTDSRKSSTATVDSSDDSKGDDTKTDTKSAKAESKSEKAADSGTSSSAGETTTPAAAN